MNLAVAIVGLPNVGKSTLFNALLKKQQAYVANFPFATIEPNIGVVPVPDERLDKLADVVAKGDSIASANVTHIASLQNDDGHRPPLVPATVEFVDIAGLIAGASKGEGLGNKFLSHIRETDAICHVMRMFEDKDIVKVSDNNLITNYLTIRTELALADLETLEKQAEPKGNASKEELERWESVKKLKIIVGDEGDPGGNTDQVVNNNDDKVAKSLGLLTWKKELVVLNVSEDQLKDSDKLEESLVTFGILKDDVVAICAKTESELSELSEDDQTAYLEALGIRHSGLERLIQKAFMTLGLITFLTAGEKEVRAWTIKKGINAQEAAGVIHTDFIKKFIKADVVDFNDFITNGGWKNCRELGKVRSEGRDYIMQDGDVVEFKIGA